MMDMFSESCNELMAITGKIPNDIKMLSESEELNSSSSDSGPKDRGEESITSPLIDNNDDVISNMEPEESPSKCTKVDRPNSSDTDSLKEVASSPLIESCEEIDDEPHEILNDETSYFKFPIREFGRRLWKSSAEAQHFLKGCIWSPDGTCILLASNLDGMHVIELPQENLDDDDDDEVQEPSLSDLKTAVHVPEAGAVYDFVWYPLMNSLEANTCCWLATRQHEPIQMWDAYSGQLRCSYLGYDDADEVEAAISLTFNSDGTKVFGGYKKTIKIFDTPVPGREYDVIRTPSAVSCFALADEVGNCITAGSWSSTITHYDRRVGNLGRLFTLRGHRSGITMLRYLKENGNCKYLFSGARKDNNLFQWDMRNYKKPYRILEREVATNQKIFFDISPMQKWLISGDTRGLINIWDLQNTAEQRDKMQLQLHDDVCNGVSIHPTLPVLATTSGQFHFCNDLLDHDDNKPCVKEIPYENALVFLRLGQKPPSNLQETERL